MYPSKLIKKESEIYNVFFCFPKKRTSLHGKKELQITNMLQRHKTEVFIMRGPEG